MNNNQLTPQQPNNYQDDEIDLYELFQSIWQEKILIVIITAVVTIFAIGYALTITPIYQVQSIVRPVTIKDLDELNGTEIYKLNPTQALQQVGASLRSYETRLNYFKANQALFEKILLPNKSIEQIFQDFNQNGIKTLTPDAKTTDDLSKYVGIQLQFSKGVDGTAIVNGLISYTINQEKQQVTDNLAAIIENNLERLELKIDSARAGYLANKKSQIAKLTEDDKLKKLQLLDELTALRDELKTKRLNRIKELDEAIAIAKSMGINKPATPSSLTKNSQASGNVVYTEITNQQIPLYFMGTKALNAERVILTARTNDDFTSDRIVAITKSLKLLEQNRQVEILKARENEDLFITEIEEDRKEIARLKGLSVDMDKLKLVRIDQQAIEAISPIKPNKLLIVAVGIVLGGMLGLFTALIRSFIRKRQETV